MRIYKLIVLNRKVYHKWKPEGMYGSWFLKNLINRFIFAGNISKVESLIYNSFKMFKFTYECDASELIVLIVEHFKMNIGLKLYRKGKVNILVPKILPASQNIRFAIRNVKNFIVSFDTQEHLFNTLQFKLFFFLAAYLEGKIDYFPTKRLICRIAMRRKKFLHFRW